MNSQEAQTFQQTGQSSEMPVAGFDPGAPMHPTMDFVQYMKAYARANPEVAAMWCFGIGFVLGWKIKPW